MSAVDLEIPILLQRLHDELDPVADEPGGPRRGEGPAVVGLHVVLKSGNSSSVLWIRSVLADSSPLDSL